jgi:hypothetical protein
MKSMMLYPPLRNAGAVVREAFAWWISELRDLIPESLRRGSSRRPDLFITLDTTQGGAALVLVSAAEAGYGEGVRIPLSAVGSESRPAEVSALLSDARHRLTVALLTPKQVFRTKLRLPAAAAPMLQRVVGHEIERLVPLDPAELRFACRVVARDPEAGRLVAEVAIVRKAVLDRLASEARWLGVELAAIRVSGETERAGFDFLPFAATAGGGGFTRRKLPRLLEAAAGALCVAALGIHLLQLGFLRDQLATEIPEARKAAEAVEAMRRELNAAVERRRFLAEKARMPSPARILAKVTHLLPDDSWVFEFSLHEREIRLHGISPSASDLVPRIDASSFFRNARFRSPTTQALGGKGERFDISFDLKPEDGP